MPRTTRSSSQKAQNPLKASNKNHMKTTGNHKSTSRNQNTNKFFQNHFDATGNKSKAAKGRAALGEITNAFSETKSQAKKGLSKMLSKSKSTLTSQASLRKAKSVEDQKSTLFKAGKDIEIDEGDKSGQTYSLPSSQQSHSEEDENMDFGNQENQSGDDSDESFESAEEGDDEDNRKLSKRQIPPNVIDFDAKHADDPFQVSEYVNDSFEYYKNREPQFRCPSYIPSFQTEITASMRGILVDWLVEVQESFELNHETLYTAVKLIDLFLSKVKSRKEDLQLIGATACLIACKIDERLPPLLDDFVYVCDDAYTKEDIKKMEMKMIRAVEYDVGYPLSYRYLRRYGRVCQVTMPVLTFGRFVLEMALMEYDLNVEISESQLAVAALALTFLITKQCQPNWKETVEFYSGHKLEDCKHLVHKLHKMLLRSPHESRKTIRTKYEHDVFHRVAKTPISTELEFDF